jgi:hypothetical protein
MSGDTHMKLRILQTPLALAIAALCAPAFAVEANLGSDVKLTVDTTVTAGTNVRTTDPSPEVYGVVSALSIGFQPGRMGGNTGLNTLNFTKGDAFSTAIKAFIDADLNVKKNFGAVVRAKLWYDDELNNGDRLYGNFPNRFRPNAPLSDVGFARAAKFDGAMVSDAYAYAKVGLGGDSSIDLKAGRHVLNWGTAQIFPNGINVINGIDGAATARAGSLPEEQRVSNGMISAALSLGKNWGLDGFVQYEFKPTVQNPCGTFFSVTEFAPEGCNFVNALDVAGLPDQAALATGRFAKRLPDQLASDSGQWGMSLRWTKPEIGTELRAYAHNLHGRLPLIAAQLANIDGTHGAEPVIRLTSPNGIKYQMVYPEDIKTYGFSVNFTPNRTTRLTLEVAHRPDQPYAYNASDLIATFLTRDPRSALALYRSALTAPPGSTFNGWEEFKTTNIVFGVGKLFPGLLGSERWTAGVEFGFVKVGGLPDPATVRFGRSDDYGLAAVQGGATCVDLTRSQKACALDGFVTPTTWGVRGRIAASYPKLFAGVDVSPSLFFQQDVKGYAPNDFFIEGRYVLRPAVRFDVKPFFAEVAYVGTGGGTYNRNIDRDFFSLSVGAKF